MVLGKKYDEKSAALCWKISIHMLRFQQIVPSQNPSNHPICFILIHLFCWTKKKIDTLLQGFFCFLQVLLHLWDRPFFGKIIWAFLGEDNHLWFWSNTSQNLWKIYAVKFNFLRPLYFDCFQWFWNHWTITIECFLRVQPLVFEFLGQWSIMVLLVRFATAMHDNKY